MPQPSWRVTVGMAKESTWGTAVHPPTVFWSTDKPSFVEKQDNVFDRGIRGIRAEAQSLTFGAGHSELDIPDMPFYGDDSGNLLMALLGSDTLTAAGGKVGTIASASAGATSLTYTLTSGGAPVIGDIFQLVDATNGNEIVTVTAVSGAGPYTLTVAATKYAHGALTPANSLSVHTLTLLNTGAPPSYTVEKYDALNGANARQLTGVYWTELTIKYTNPGAMTCDIKGTGKMGTNVTTGTAVYSTVPFFVPWQAAFTIGGTANARVVDMEFTLKAPSTQIFGMAATQSPTAAVAGRVSLTGKFTVVPDDYTEFNYYINNTQPSCVIDVNNGLNWATFQMSKTAFIDPTQLDHSGDHTMLTASYEAISNATDGAAPGSGNAPIRAILRNLKTALY